MNITKPDSETERAQAQHNQENNVVERTAARRHGGTSLSAVVGVCMSQLSRMVTGTNLRPEDLI